MAEISDHIQKLPEREDLFNSLLIGNGRNSDIFQVRATLILGKVAWQRGNFSLALDYYYAAQAISEVAGDKSGAAKAMNGIGRVHWNLGFYDKALEYYSKALAMCEELGEKIIEVQNEEVKKQANRYGWERKIAEMEKEREIEKIRTEAEKQRMELEIEHQTREVENMVHELVRKNALLQQIQSDIKKITPHTHHEGTPHIEHLLDRVERNITPLESITGLEQQLTEVHGKFMNEL